MGWLRELFHAGVLIAAGAGVALASPSAPAGTIPPWVEASPEPDPLVWTTLFTWYTEESFRCAAVQPLGGPFRSDDEAYYREYFGLLRAHGVDVVAGVVTGFATEDLPGSWAARNLLRAIPLMKDAGLRHVPYYDLAIRSYWRSGVTVKEMNLDRHPLLARQLVSDFAAIADHFIFPVDGVHHGSERIVAPWEADIYRSTQLYLEDRDGRLILDEVNGRPRPVIGLYLSRVLLDDSDFATLRRVFDHDIPQVFHQRGLGRPALVLDELWWGTLFNERRVAAFGSTAVALTAFGPVSSGLGPTTIGEWAEAFADLYALSLEKLQRLAAQGGHLAGLSIWPGVLHNFDKRAYGNCDGRRHHAYPALAPDQWETMLRNGLDAVVAVTAVGSAGSRPARGALVWYTDEYFEGLATCAAPNEYGTFSYPNHHGCDPLEALVRIRSELRSR